MTKIIVNDASSLIDLRKANLLSELGKLPYKLVVPLPIRDSELLKFTAKEWEYLEDAGLEVVDLGPEEVELVFSLKGKHSRLSANDCFCLICTKTEEGGVLLTGDRLLKRVAQENDVSVFGTLWVIDLLSRIPTCPNERLVIGLQIWLEDPTVFIPSHEVKKRIVALS